MAAFVLFSSFQVGNAGGPSPDNMSPGRDVILTALLKLTLFC